MTHWLWWAPNEEVNYPANVNSLSEIKECLLVELDAHFDWMLETLIFHGLTREKIKLWKEQCGQYFAIG